MDFGVQQSKAMKKSGPLGENIEEQKLQETKKWLKDIETITGLVTSNGGGKIVIFDHIII